MMCPACGASHAGAGDTTDDPAGPEPDTLWRAVCWRCGWAVVAAYPEDATGVANDHACPGCPTCGHHDRQAPAAAR